MDYSGLGLSYSEYQVNDVVTDSVVNDKARNDGEDINLLHGTLTVENGIDRGVLMFSKVTDKYFAVNEIDKLLLDDLSAPLYFTAEEWLVNKVLSNYNSPSINLSNINIKSSELPTNVLATITDVNQFADSLFMINGYSYNIYSSNVNLQLTSIVKDNMNVIST